MPAESASTLSVTAEAVAGATLLQATGVLDFTTYLLLRDAIVKAALAETAAVIVNVSALSIPAPSAWAVFTSARWHVGTWPEVPIMLVCEHVAGRRDAARNGITRYLPVYATQQSAIAGLAAQSTPLTRRRTHKVLSANTDSLWQSRRMVEEWLTAWSLPEYIPATNVIMTALIENVLEHTESEPSVRLETDGSTVTVAVADSSHSPPALQEKQDGALGPNPASGLNIVAAMCRVWGNAPTSSGKTVWAVIGPENKL